MVNAHKFSPMIIKQIDSHSQQKLVQLVSVPEQRCCILSGTLACSRREFVRSKACWNLLYTLQLAFSYLYVCVCFPAYGNLGSVLSSQGRVEEAEWAYRMALKCRSNMADVHYNL